MILKHQERLIDTHIIREEVLKIIEETPILKKKISIALEQEPIKEEALLEEVLKFLYLVTVYKQTLSPSYWVDQAWHEFILCTRLYHHYCTQYLGRYIHHTPDDNTLNNQSNFKQTIKLYILHFGAPDKKIWGDWAYEEWSEAQCGACSS
ncbi:glycine-rich domain-containing protein [Aquimarina rhabdastrellae]